MRLGAVLSLFLCRGQKQEPPWSLSGVQRAGIRVFWWIMQFGEHWNRIDDLSCGAALSRGWWGEHTTVLRAGKALAPSNMDCRPESSTLHLNRSIRILTRTACLWTAWLIRCVLYHHARAGFCGIRAASMLASLLHRGTAVPSRLRALGAHRTMAAAAASSQYDLVVIGGGPGGYVAAIKAAQLGLKVGRRHYRVLCRIKVLYSSKARRIYRA